MHFQSAQSFYKVDFSSTQEGLVLTSDTSTSGPASSRPVLNKDVVSKVLRSVPEQEGFHFYLAIGEPTEEIAVSLADFVEKMSVVDVRSVNFHYTRKDFEKWIRAVFGDAELALRLGRIGRIRLGIQGEALRNEIIRTVKMRLSELKPPLPATSKPPSYGGTSETGRTSALF
jgi:hypothetical protein